MKYIVRIEEMISEDFEVEAPDIGTAMEIAEEKYNKGEFVLEPGRLVAKQMSARATEGNDCTEWMEF